MSIGSKWNPFSWQGARRCAPTILLSLFLASSAQAARPSTTLQGEFLITHWHDFTNHKVVTHYHLKHKGRTVELFFPPGQRPKIKNGQLVSATGSLSDGQLSLDSPMAVQPLTGVLQTSALTASSTRQTMGPIGQQNVIAILFVCAPQTADPGVTKASVASLLFGPAPSLTDYWQKTSYGQTSATGQVFGPYISTSTACGKVIGSTDVDDPLVSAAAADG